MLNANTYVTKEEGIGGTIRNRWEDFYVEEIPEVIPEGEGPNIYIWIEKLGRTTLDVLLDIARDLHIDRKRMGFAGMKDKKAITRQWICIANMDSDEQFSEVESLAGTIHNTEFLKVLRGRKKLRMGQLKGNKFRILVKEIDGMDSEDENIRREAIEDAAKRADAILKTLEKTGVPNYFGWQRFGKPRTNTHLVGEALIQNDLKEAVRRYIGNPHEGESEDTRLARQAYDDGDLEKSLELMHPGMRYEKMMLNALIKEEKRAIRKIAEKEGIDIDDLDKSKVELSDKAYKNAIHALPKPLQRMFVHAYQSYLFNAAVSERVAMGMDKYIEGDIVIDKEEHIVRDKSHEEFQEMVSSFEINQTSPLYGTKVPFAGGKVGKMEEEILNSYNLTKADFEVSKMPRLGSHGLRRAMRFQLWDASAKASEDGVICEFSIDKGSYATAVLREVMKKDVY
ncbi:tRNA pseudouridine(13) synthase TruD [Methanobrevibacter olleyae]|uniref:Probable tRNA pseudouridine synthase D n=1 Tax=Methanobrevibacter olleyae TaxID=294671 RepID=A0A126R2U3_METOL|nr:tRNA pseudouridine(13) synthase TruD [Methanobrevibacter olleyae]AMK16374.1 tRNA pseudouridine synthase D TruD [Methanobrevibacter olleyae]SFL50175.1 tRNA pseudouridine13 synthase [Methanobrevibacter olleyae]